MSSTIVVFGLMATVLALAPLERSADPSARRCSCVEAWSIAEARARSVAVFTGQVIALRRLREDSSYFAPERGHVARLVVRARWKGAEQDTLDVSTPPTGGGCGFPFQLRRRYLVFAMDDGDGLYTVVCLPTQRERGAWAMRRALGPPLAELSGGRPTTASYSSVHNDAFRPHTRRHEEQIVGSR